MMDIIQSLPSHIGSITTYVSGAQPSTSWQPPEEKLLTETKIKCLKALKWWATDLTLRGKHMVLAEFDASMMADCIVEVKLDYEDGKKYPYIEKPDKLS